MIGYLTTDVEYKPQTAKDPPQLSISPNPSLPPRITVLYRTLPRYTTVSRSDYAYLPRDRLEAQLLHQHRGQNERERKMDQVDRFFRPDLRLARSDPGVKKVAEVVRWFAEWVGGEGPS